MWDMVCKSSQAKLKPMDLPEHILRTYNTLAIVGASRDPQKSAHGVPASLQRAGFKIVPVNPRVDGMLLGETTYASLSAIPFPVDVVVVFRPATDVPPIAQEAVHIGAKALWLQQGITSSEAKIIAKQAGLLYVEDQCTAVVRALYGITK